MTDYDTDALRALVREDGVHRSIYQDEEIFRLEMDRIFGRAWVYVAHESQIPRPGDFFSTRIGAQPVIVARHSDGAINVLYNRCTHRGSKLCNEESGNTRHFRCAYHGWAFQTDGSVFAIPFREAYPEGFDGNAEGLGLKRAARVDSYRGFVFASLAADGPGLLAYLGGIRFGLDDICDRAPDGEIALSAGVLKYKYHGNWKFQVDNLTDMYHPHFSHESTTQLGGEQFERHEGQTGPRFFEDYDGNAGRALSMDPCGLFVYDEGHGQEGGLPMRKQAAPIADVIEHRRLLVARHGEKRAEEILDFDRHNGSIYPNLSFQALGQNIRVVEPIAVDLTYIYVYPLILKGAPDAINEEAIRNCSVTHSASSMVQGDDVECFVRQQAGLSGVGDGWLFFGRYLGAEHERADGFGGRAAPGTSEAVLRAQYRAWLGMMCADA